ncbi:uncharacterized protein (DUF2249 family) [Marmoricola bigeumensis]|uniref:Uncharacterized protein (DUF2249 family) n=1 Tax=Nocardioides marmoribigeumensis TaxID=433649 RepID=A0ABU2BTV1_9ACTN|nr:DUF2249 domain-containing protein [Nocardioides marmoribigeumensis]MDR7362050.1 uncharacterized protein (DUF2249 family) [Nocardioides marmoribigeumensis]
MSQLVIASNEADARAAEAVRDHHASMAGALRLRVETLVDAAARGEAAAGEEARTDLRAWCEAELVPHALAEEKEMYPAAQATLEGRLLVQSMLGEHDVVRELVQELADAPDLTRAAAAATALRVVFDSHLGKENDLVLPLLAATPGVSVATMLEGMHELLGEGASAVSAGASAEAGCGGHTCTCGEQDGPGHPELDARTIPHAIRHATIFGALESVRPGRGLELVAPHDPLPLLAQVEQRWPGVFSVTYRERGPEAWRLVLLREG